MDTKTILNAIIPNIENEVPLYSDQASKIELYEKTPGRWFLKSHDAEQRELLVWNEEKKEGKPEEIVRQLFLYALTDKYNYPIERIFTEQTVNFGREKKRLDVIVYQEDRITAWIVAEIKAPQELNDVKQLKSYANSEGAVVSAGTNGKEITVFVRPYPKEFRPLPDLPYSHETNLPDDILNRNWTLDKLDATAGKQSLRSIVETLEDTVLANAGVDGFNEIFKLIYAKLYDEYGAEHLIDRDQPTLFFRQYGNSEETFIRIEELFKKAKAKWPGVFDNTEQIKLKPEHLDICVSKLAGLKLFGANLQIIDEAFEFLIPDVVKGKKGQYFTPRIVIDAMVQMMNPTKEEYVIDPACGSAGFLVHVMQFVWQKNNLNNREQKQNYAEKFVWGVDFDEKSTKISRALMLIAGDGKSHIYQENSLNILDWQRNERLKSDLGQEGLISDSEMKHLNFDIVLANPPFAGNIEEPEILRDYNLAKKNGKTATNMSRHLLFIERCLNLLKPGGRMGIVLPQGVFNNTTEKFVRDFVSDHGRILGVLSLHVNSFKPHTGTKTSVLFVQKWNNNPDIGPLCPEVDDYPIFFAISENSFKDNSGNYIYMDQQNHKLKSDLFEIAEEFSKWAKEENLSFS